jgi:hypothetical protein
LPKCIGGASYSTRSKRFALSLRMVETFRTGLQNPSCSSKTKKMQTRTLPVVPFQTKLELAGQMLIGIGHYFPTSPLLAVTDSWFGNQSLWRQVRKVLGDRFNT